MARFSVVGDHPNHTIFNQSTNECDIIMPVFLAVNEDPCFFLLAHSRRTCSVAITRASQDD